MEYLLRGILIGLLFGLPVGAVGALTVQRTWSLGAKAGLLTIKNRAVKFQLRTINRIYGAVLCVFGVVVLSGCSSKTKILEGGVPYEKGHIFPVDFNFHLDYAVDRVWKFLAGREQFFCSSGAITFFRINTCSKAGRY